MKFLHFPCHMYILRDFRYWVPSLSLYSKWDHTSRILSTVAGQNLRVGEGSLTYERFLQETPKFLQDNFLNSYVPHSDAKHRRSLPRLLSKLTFNSSIYVFFFFKCQPLPMPYIFILVLKPMTSPCSTPIPLGFFPLSFFFFVLFHGDILTARGIKGKDSLRLLHSLFRWFICSKTLLHLSQSFTFYGINRFVSLYPKGLSQRNPTKNYCRRWECKKKGLGCKLWCKHEIWHRCTLDPCNEFLPRTQSASHTWAN